MSHRARDAGTSAVRPLSPPKPVKANPKRIARHCYNCGDHQARPLPSVYCRSKGSVFCCLRCAAQYAIDFFETTRVAWCNVHKDWTDEAGLCHQCHQIELQLAGESEADAKAQARAGKAVSHEQ